MSRLGTLLFSVCAVVGCGVTHGPGPGPLFDSGVADAGAADAGTAANRCRVTEAEVRCTFATTSLPAGGGTRVVDYQVPGGPPPDSGWPAVLFFQGSLFAAEYIFGADAGDPFGAYNEALTTAGLLDAGFAVIVPQTSGNNTFWDTNVPPWDLLWHGAPDDQLMQAIFATLVDGGFGPLDPGRLHATGISSGGFMTSRMAVSYPGRFRSLAIHSASYATCGAICVVPQPLPAGHPPTLFMHGARDAIVPLSEMTAYEQALLNEGFETRAVIDPDAGHQWLEAGPTAVLEWFTAHP